MELPPQPSQPAPARGKSDGPDFAALQRPQTPNGSRAVDLSILFHGYWHRGKQGPSRKANPAKDIKGCHQFEALKARNLETTPKGDRGAYDKARVLARDNCPAESPKVNHREDTEDDD